ncbi:MAG: SGNH/GDSL hydrolase family protein [Psychroflexus sp.]|nr:SGNH/GDSL hydrolase family protein [Psychroflexus sp.]
MQFEIALILCLITQFVMAQTEHNYLALGDSYTIGESLPVEEAWPYLLIRDAQTYNLDFSAPTIIAKTGWRTDELITAIEDKGLQQNSYDLVSLLIGVNNQYQSKPLETYKKEFHELLEKAIYFAKNDMKSVFVVSIPDYSTSFFALKSDKKNIRQAIDDYNTYAKHLCGIHDIPFYDITALSHQLNMQKGMLAEDDLHPSALQYQKWVAEFLPNFVTDFSNLKNE